MDKIADNPARLLNADGRVATDLPCVRCGYNLRTLAENAVCPECARLVLDSLHAQYLRHAPAKWVIRLAEGARALLVAFCCSVSTPLFVTALVTTRSDVATVLAGLLGVTGVGVAVVAAFGGVIVLTERNPALADCPESMTARRLTRWSLAAVIPICMLSGMAGIFWPTIPHVATALLLLDFVAAVAIPLTLCRHIGDLMRLVPRQELTRYARYQLRGLLGVAVTFAAGLVMESAKPGPIDRLGETLMTLAALAAIPTTIGFFVLIVLVDRALAKVARGAKRRAAQTQ